jgi:hypothetical protein
MTMIVAAVIVIVSCSSAWPLGHLFNTPELGPQELRVLPNIGSAHFPVLGWRGFLPDDGSRKGGR